MTTIEVNACCAYPIEKPNDCTWEAIVKVDKEEWDKELVIMNCPKCNAILRQIDGHFDLIL